MTFSTPAEPTGAPIRATRGRLAHGQPAPSENGGVHRRTGSRRAPAEHPRRRRGGRSLIGVLAVTAVAMAWGSGATAMWTLSAGVIAGAIALQRSPGGRVPLVVTGSVELAIAVLLGTLAGRLAGVHRRGGAVVLRRRHAVVARCQCWSGGLGGQRTAGSDATDRPDARAGPDGTRSRGDRRCGAGRTHRRVATPALAGPARRTHPRLPVIGHRFTATSRPTAQPTSTTRRSPGYVRCSPTARSASDRGPITADTGCPNASPAHWPSCMPPPTTRPTTAPRPTTGWHNC